MKWLTHLIGEREIVRAEYWRRLHRWIAPCAVVFLTIISATGVYMQVEALWGAYDQAPRTEAHALPTRDLSLWFDAALAAAQRAQPQEGITGVSVSMDGARPRADIVWSRSDIPELSIDPQTGRQFRSSDATDLSLYRKLSRLILQLHRGDLLGLPGRWLGLACGIALLTLGVTGLIMYFNVYRQRIKLRRLSPFW